MNPYSEGRSRLAAGVRQTTRRHTPAHHPARRRQTPVTCRWKNVGQFRTVLVRCKNTAQGEDKKFTVHSCHPSAHTSPRPCHASPPPCRTPADTNPTSRRTLATSLGRSTLIYCSGHTLWGNLWYHVTLHMRCCGKGGVAGHKKGAALA